jgi:uncharacterized membrane protein
MLDFLAKWRCRCGCNQGRQSASHERGETIGFEGWSMRVRLDEASMKQMAAITRAESCYAVTGQDLKTGYQSRAPERAALTY